MQTQTLKDVLAEVIKSLPPSSSFDEILFKVNLAAKAYQGLKDKEEGKVVSTEDLLKRIEKW